MKQIALVTALAAVAATAAHADVDVYGKVHLGLDYVTEDTGSADENAIQLNSNASRIGFKGSEELSPNLEVFYTAEAEAYFDTGDNSDKDFFGARNVYAGLNHISLGSVLAGRKDTLIKEAQGKVDLFNDLVAGDFDMKKTISGEERDDNLIEYHAPTDNLPVELKIGLGLDNNTEDLADNDKNDAVYVSLGYNYAGVGLTAAYGSNAAADFPGAGSKDELADIIRVVADYDLNGVKLGGLYQNAEPATDSALNGVVDAEDAFLISASFKASSDLTVGAQYQMSSTSFENGAEDVDIMQYGLIGTYKVAKPMKVHGYLANRNTDNGATDEDTMVIGTAVEYKF